jgi:prepilin-type N-terminal cleavage/methylation domain-containing protein
MKTPDRKRSAFTLIELLVVVAIIAILASLLLPALARGKRQVHVTTCLNHFQQMGLALHMFATDSQRYASSLGGREIPDEFACGEPLEDRLAEMRARSLYSYFDPNSKIWECPEDKGMDFRPDGPFYGPTARYAFGLSYRLNTGPWIHTKYEVAGTLPRQREGWVQQPSEYIYVYEPPAVPMIKPLLPLCDGGVILEPYMYFHWHLNTGPSSVFDIAGDGQKAISPILFVDGHAARHDFTKSLHQDWRYPTEATKDWIWYQPVIGANGMPVPNT